MKKKVSAFLVGASALALAAMPVQAVSILPKAITDIFTLFGTDGRNIASFTRDRLTFALSLALGLLILVAVVYALIAAFKYIQSQGDPGKIEEAQKAIKAIFMGIAAMLVGIVGIVLVFVFFGSSGSLPSLDQTCLSAPGSQGCRACQLGGQYVERDPTKASGYRAIPQADGGPASGSADATNATLCAKCETLYDDPNGAAVVDAQCI